MMHLYKYSLTEIETMIPWERDIYVELLREHIESENNRLANKRNEAAAQDALRKRYR
jgi:hypothetical protein